MKYSVEEILDLLAIDETLYPSGKPVDEIADLHCALADMVVEGKISLVFDKDNRPMFKAPSAIPVKIPLTITKEMLN